MTTIIGIKAEKGEQGIVLASDLTGTHSRWTPQEDIAFRETFKSENQKIYVDDKRNFVMAMAGVRDEIYLEFLSEVLREEIDFKKYAEAGFFDPLLKLHISRFDGRVWQSDLSNSLVIATRYEGVPKLYSCWPLGKIEEKVYAAIGSGSRHVYDLFSEQQRLTSKDISLKDAAELAIKGAERASSTDLHSGGLDIVIVKGDKIEEYGPRIKAEMEQARQRVVTNIIAGLEKTVQLN